MHKVKARNVQAVMLLECSLGVSCYVKLNLLLWSVYGVQIFSAFSGESEGIVFDFEIVNLGKLLFSILISMFLIILGI